MNEEADGTSHLTFTKIAYSCCRKLLVISSLVRMLPAIQVTTRRLVTQRALLIATTIAIRIGMNKFQPLSPAPIRKVLMGEPRTTLVRTTWVLFAHHETLRRS